VLASCASGATRAWSASAQRCAFEQDPGQGGSPSRDSRERSGRSAPATSVPFRPLSPRVGSQFLRHPSAVLAALATSHAMFEYYGDRVSQLRGISAVHLHRRAIELRQDSDTSSRQNDSAARTKQRRRALPQRVDAVATAITAHGALLALMFMFRRASKPKRAIRVVPYVLDLRETDPQTADRPRSHRINDLR
jgi:hypothetical protein